MATKIKVIGSILLGDGPYLALNRENADIIAEVEIDLTCGGEFSERDLAYQIAQSTDEEFMDIKSLNISGLRYTIEGQEEQMFKAEYWHFIKQGPMFITLTDILFPPHLFA